MEDFLRSCVSRYQELTGVTTLRKASTPFLPEPTRPDFRSAATDAVSEQEVNDATEALLAVINNDDTTTARTADVSDDDNVPKQLAVYAAKVLMKILYAARYARFDLLRAVCVLAQHVSKWDRECDVKLYRLICYINGSLHIRMTGWIGDERRDSLRPHLFADADFAGCSKTSCSTSGVHLSLLGPNSVWPMAGQSKTQGCVSHSTPESEIVAADHALRTVGIPALDLWSILLERPDIVITFHEDDETANIAMRQGWSSTMRHMERTRGLCLRSLAENIRGKRFDLCYQRSALQSADIYTKAFADTVDWVRAQKLVSHLDPKLFWDGCTDSSMSPTPSEHKGGVRYDYWTPNPLLCTRACSATTKAQAIPAAMRSTDAYDDDRLYDETL